MHVLTKKKRFEKEKKTLKSQLLSIVCVFVGTHLYVSVRVKSSIGQGKEHTAPGTPSCRSCYILEKKGERQKNRQKDKERDTHIYTEDCHFIVLKQFHITGVLPKPSEVTFFIFNTVQISFQNIWSHLSPPDMC